MFMFIKKIFYIGSLCLSSLVSATPLSCISLKNQECKVRPKIADINSNNPIFYPFSIKINKCSGSCNNINNPYAKICVSDTVKDLNVRVCNLMSRTNETRHYAYNYKIKNIQIILKMENEKVSKKLKSSYLVIAISSKKHSNSKETEMRDSSTWDPD